MTTTTISGAVLKRNPVSALMRRVRGTFQKVEYTFRLSRLVVELFELSDSELRQRGISRAEICDYAEKKLQNRK